MKITQYKIIYFLIILSGLLLFPTLADKGGMVISNRFYISQIAVFTFVSGILGAMLLWKFNKLISILSGLLIFGVLKTIVLQEAPLLNIYESAIQGFGIFIVYYFFRSINTKEDLLNWFLVPSVLNILIIFVQKLDHHILYFLPFDSVTGLLGNPGMSAGYIALTMPLLYKRSKILCLLGLMAIIFCNASMAFLASVSGVMFYLYFNKRRNFRIGFLLLILFSLLFIKFADINSYKNEIHFRATMIVGATHFGLHNPVLGWGVGAFAPIMSIVKPEDSIYLGIPFNTPHAFMNNPHNEIVSGFCKIGIAFPILIVLIFIDKIKRFNPNNVMPFSILIAGSVYSMGYFFTLPLCLLFISALSIYENQGG